MHVKRVLILHGDVAPDAAPDEQDSLAQVHAVAKALQSLGHRAESVPVSLDLKALKGTLGDFSPDVVFNLVETLEGRMVLTSLVPILLESLGQPFTGCGSRALIDTTDKCLTKRRLRSAGIPTPPWYDRMLGPQGDLAFPATMIVKSVSEDGSIGLGAHSVREFSSEHDVRNAISDAERAQGGEWFAEQFVGGREFNVGVLEGKGREPAVLPIAEIDFDGYPKGSPPIVGYAAKWDESSKEYHATTPRFDRLVGEQELDRALRALALQCWTEFKLRGYARVDVRLSEHGVPCVLEINANPCITPGAGFPHAAEKAGLSYAQLIETILSSAESRLCVQNQVLS
jgi:D-alanine-D-alanine ligase